MFLSELEAVRPGGMPEGAGPDAAPPVSGVRRLLAYRPERTVHLNRYTQAVMRGPSDLSPGQRELIAAFSSARNNCPF